MPKIWVSLNQEYPKTAFYEGNYVESARVVEKSVRLCVWLSDLRLFMYRATVPEVW